jgi:hypothetical protein
LKEDFRPNKFFLSNIFHDWSLETDLKLATFAFQALPSGGQMILHEMPLEELSVLLGSGGEDDGKEENAYEKSLAVGFSEILRVWTERDRGRAHRGWLRSDRHLRRTRPVLLDST